MIDERARCPAGAPSTLAGVGVRRRGRAGRRRRRRALVADGDAAEAADRGRRAPCAFYGEHQAGIVTAAQDRLHFVAFDVITKDRERAGRAAAGVDGRGRPDDRRAGRRA